MTAAVEIRDLVKKYGDLEAVRGISLSVRTGGFFGFLGPNGAGKTTTINVLTGLANRTSGEVRIFGKDVRDEYVACRRRIGLAPQEFNFDRFFSVRRLLEFEAGYFGMPRREALRRADDLLRRFDLWDKRDQRPPTLSGGQKRRLQIAKALVHDPDILILDEPTAGVDVELRHDFWRHLRELNAAGKTIVLTTHYLEEAERLCEEIAIIHLGRIVEYGRTEELTRKNGRTLEDIFLSHIHASKKDAPVPL